MLAYDSTGASRTFANLPPKPGCAGSGLEDYLASVPQGQPGWTAGTTYVARGSKIYSLTQDGQVSLLTGWPCADDRIAGITFDTQGLLTSMVDRRSGSLTLKPAPEMCSAAARSWR